MCLIIGIGLLVTSSFKDEVTSTVSLITSVVLTIFAMFPGLKSFLTNIFKGESQILEDKLIKINNKLGFMSEVRKKLEVLSQILERFNCQPIIFIDDIDSANMIRQYKY